MGPQDVPLEGGRIKIRRHSALVNAERARGCEPEFDRVTLIRHAVELAPLDGAPADYLRPLLNRFASADKLLPPRIGLDPVT